MSTELTPRQLPGYGPSTARFLRRREFGAALRTRRLARGWTQRELADRLTLPRHGVSDLERGRRWPSTDEARRLVGVMREERVCPVSVPYCGRRSPEVLLEVDHITPVASGGNDDPENLTTACFDCNRGRAARELGRPAPLDYAERAARMQEQELQIEEYGRWRSAQRAREDEEIEKLSEVFAAIPGASFRRGQDERWCWQEVSVRTFIRRIGFHDVLEALEVTQARSPRVLGRDAGERAEGVWRFFCSVCWRKIKE